MASSLARTVAATMESEDFDLAGFSQAQAQDLAQAAFKEPRKLQQMIRLTFAVGAGKGGRSRYDDDLPKWFMAALKEVGYEDDRGASLAFECAGSFKYQHDTGKNIKYVHVFPLAEQDQGNEGEEGADVDEEDDLEDEMSPEWLCVVSELETFEKMVASKMPAWVQKKRCIALFKDYLAKLDAVEATLVRGEMLSKEEERIYANISRDGLEAKQAFLLAKMKEMVDQGKITQAEKQDLIDGVSNKIQVAEVSIAEEANATKKDKMVKALEQLKARKTKLESISPITHPLKHGAKLKSVWQRIIPMEKLLEKAGPMGRWSQKLSPAEVEYLGGKDDLDAELEELQDASRCWFEEESEFGIRLAKEKGSVKPTAPKMKKTVPKPNPGGWSTVSRSKPKGNKSKGFVAPKPKRGGGGFAALGGDSDSD